ncbi:MAG: lipid-A-disaccharide synthase [Nitrospinaceae bacterium]|jgi:lipid-A-disaccharide synthase|nr:lipid-A-disaccharide synthase [Nitrospinaceae bacterium]MBT3434908.1 lipid-A-disaccharide synthase [Nitrospinaceae bacterium]MBT4093962.1 lipid-A-disaccharide synthase [Nitrospinaceae bacterium]MBT4431054.1 lipid-A-disaccharide synthase [Nitrospinaceae bacterium]MBT5367674.1 lipid-A-disaccharide synthase [Nitrospinaceae bacterium]
MSANDVRFMVVAGEPSGDLHAARLIRALSTEIPGSSAFGVGGNEMRGVGVEILHDCGPLDVIGFGGVPKVLPALLRIKRDLLSRVRASRPAAVILVDYPGFNLSLAKSFSRLPEPPQLIYFIPPQVWAWKTGRARTLARICDLILTIYPFEPPIFRREGGRAEFIGNPVAYALRDAPSRQEARAELGISDSDRVVSFLPGSRRSEITRLLEPMMDSSEILEKQFPGTIFLMSEAEALTEGTIQKMLATGRVRVVRGSQHSLVRASDATVVASGTAALECALLGTPMNVCYAGDVFSYLLAKYFFLQVDFISLPNLLAGWEVVPELLQKQVRGDKIAASLASLLDDSETRERQLRVFGEIRETLAGADPYERAATSIRMALEKTT